MKVVLFCGGLGMRLRDYSDNVPKPLIPIGKQPILWHLMKYYAHYGHKEFILCLGGHGEAIKRHFLNGKQPSQEPLRDETEDWSITFVDTGLHANVGERLKAVERYVAGEKMFLANYADGLTDNPLPDQIAHAERLGATATFLSVKPNLSYHTITADPRGMVTSVHEVAESGVRINGGFFVFRPEIFRYLEAGEDLVNEPFHRLISARQLAAYRYDGFWLAVDTAKDKLRVDELAARGSPPWEVWKTKAPAEVE